MTPSLSGKSAIRHLNLKLAELGLPQYEAAINPEAAANVASFIARVREKDRLLANHLCPPDARIQSFLYDYLSDTTTAPRLPAQTLIFDRAGIARVASLPPDRDEAVSPLLSSYRLENGILHNPKSDRRTTEGIFHVTEGGLPIPADKKATPKKTFALLLAHALRPPAELLRLPFTASQEEHAECWASLYIRPVVCPAAPGLGGEQRMEVRLFAPGSLVSNLDFVESIFGNAGDPTLPENDAALDPEHWTGHTGCVILAPHLAGSLTKKELGLPSWDEATERQRRDGMAWKAAEEKYNDGRAFKITARDASGVIVTILADNYYGYCKKEVKTQISFSANLFGLAEEEHAGGALVFPCYDLASEYDANLHRAEVVQTFADFAHSLGETIEMKPEGHAVDKLAPSIAYVPETARFDLEAQKISWPAASGTQSIRLQLGWEYVLPSGFKVRMEKPVGNRTWRLVGTRAEGVLCHKPCTVSGGGKSEISKPITDAILHGPVFVADIQKDFDQVEALLARDYSRRFRDPSRNGGDARTILSPERSLGSVIKLLTPGADYGEEYNAWLNSVPRHIKELVFVLKRFWKPHWGSDWRSKFSVDIVNGEPSNELMVGRRKLVTQFLRVGYDQDGQWRVFGLRKDFFPAAKVQEEDDITASVIVPCSAAGALPESATQHSVKFVNNVETRLFQRPDDAYVRGYDNMAEREFTDEDNFFSNYEPLNRARASQLVDDAIGFNQFTKPAQDFIARVASTEGPGYFVCTAFPRIVDGKPTKNPRYLQLRPDIRDARSRRLAEAGMRLARRVPAGRPAPSPVTAILAGRRNNPAEQGVRSLACYGPIHYMELPELFMEFIASMTGKSPSTTGAGSEGAMTKGPFNALPPVYDLNAALTGYMISGYDGFLTSAGCLGPKARVDHDISLLVPELWCRMGNQERDPKWLIAHGMLEPLADFEHEGRIIAAGRLGYRVTRKFVNSFFGRIFNHPDAVLPDEMLRPELQDRGEFVDAVENIVATHKRVAEHYFADGSVDQACPPLRALLHVMRDGSYEGRGLSDPEVRGLFSREDLLTSEWYEERLKAKQTIEVKRWRVHASYLEKFVGRPTYAGESARLGVRDRLSRARVRLEFVRSRDFLESLRGTIGAEPSLAL
jgi:phosphoenolpyruvate carboxykinase (diphosphate)